MGKLAHLTCNTWGVNPTGGVVSPSVTEFTATRGYHGSDSISTFRPNVASTSILSVAEDRLKALRGAIDVMGEVTNLPLAVDLDGTLIFTDMSRITFRRVLLPRFWLLPWMLYLDLTNRRARWKQILGRKLKFDPAELEYNEPFLAWLKEQKATGREIVLCTASEESVAQQIADYVGLFDDVMGSDGVTNLRMEAKGKALAERYGKGQFAYAGNSSHDLKTWPYAGEVIVVNASQETINALGDRPSLVFE